MSLSSVCLPDGRTYTVQPVFGGLFFKNNEPNLHPMPFPDGWTVSLHTEEAVEDVVPKNAVENDGQSSPSAQYHQQRFRRPTLQNDALFISSIFNYSSHENQSHGSSSREIALMLWVSLYWYFQQTEPAPYLYNEKTKLTPTEAKPKGEWRIAIKPEGVLRNRNLIPKLERMGLVTSSDTSVASEIDGKERAWDQVFVTRRMFWQIPSGLFLSTIQPLKLYSSYPGSPVSSRPLSPVSSELPQGSSSVMGPLPISYDGCPSQLSTYYPPPPLQYIMTNTIRHPRRPRPPRMGEIFYSRFIPSVGKHLSFRVASLSPRHVPHLGIGENPERQGDFSHLCTQSDSLLLKRWLSKPRVSAFWGEYHDNFLSDVMRLPHSFPVIGLWDGVPFGYFEIYWVKEDLLGRHMGNDAQDFDRGLHVLVGEEWARGRVATVSNRRSIIPILPCIFRQYETTYLTPNHTLKSYPEPTLFPHP
ncbi:hypothetical protein GGS21DRAFT_287533 [Xylaria nigripes]|nr:hypothetical protein GGS21DRAFT_287533 [Xylaria nigripes]